MAMNPETKITQENDFVFRRIVEAFPDWVVGVPVAFAFLVLLLIVFFRRENRWSGMLWAFIGVGLGSAAYLALAIFLKPVFSWFVVLVPVLLVALVYVGFMYYKDAQSINPYWAGFLGVLRCTVYAILAFVFLLPGCQTYETSETHASILMLFDVSESMKTIDDIPEIGQDPATLPIRQDKVLQFLTNQLGPGNEPRPSFLERTLLKTPARLYRFGIVPDDMDVRKLENGKVLTAAELKDWLNPDKKKIVIPDKLPPEEQTKLRAKLNDLYDSLTSGTNVGGSALQVAKQEAGSFLQAIIIFSDGQSNVGSDEAVKEFLARANNPKRKVHVFTVGVGDYRQPMSIRIEDLQVPESARPDDKFLVRVPVIGAGLQDREFDVWLDLERIKDKDGKPIQEPKITLPPKKGKFNGGGDFPSDQVEFEIDLQELKKVKSEKDEGGVLEGTYRFVARVPRAEREAFPKKEHESDPPAQVLVQKRKLRILLFAGGPSREYQFVRTLLFREVQEKRADLAVYLQTGKEDEVDQDVEKEWLLTHFPDKLGPDDPRDKHSSLNEYDVIIAMDPDWTALDAKQLKLLEEWVGNHSGGVIFVAGPVHTFHLARPGGVDISSLVTIFPVTLKDSRLHGLGIGHDASRPYLLDFTKAAKLYEFLKLEDESDNPTAGWDKFFWRDAVPEAAKDARPVRGIFNYYPVEKIKPASTVIATFAGPPLSRINDGKDAQPFMVMMPYGSGKTFYLGAGETYRLRSAKEAYHQRFWIKLARYMAAGTTPQKKYGSFLMAQSARVGTIPFEVKLKGANLQPLPRDARPMIEVKRPADFDPKLDTETPEKFELRPKNLTGEWNGVFVASAKIKTPGEYEFKVPIPNTSETVSHRLIARKPNLELDNVRHNHAALYEMATAAKDVLSRLDADSRREIERLLQPPSGENGKSADGRELSRLFFKLNHADAITKCLVKIQPEKESTKGALMDLWDQGWNSGYEMSAYYLSMLIPAIVGLLAVAILLFLGHYGAALGTLIGTGVVILGVFLFGDPDWIYLPMDMSFVLAVVVGLLSMEWLTRKLLKLA